LNVADVFLFFEFLMQEGTKKQSSYASIVR